MNSLLAAEPKFRNWSQPGDLKVESIMTACALRFDGERWLGRDARIPELEERRRFLTLAIRCERSAMLPASSEECFALLFQLYRARAAAEGWLQSRRSVGILGVWLFLRLSDQPTPMEWMAPEGEVVWRRIAPVERQLVGSAARAWLLTDLLSQGAFGRLHEPADVEAKPAESPAGAVKTDKAG